MMSLKSKNELLEVVRPRYLKASKFEKQKILDEFTSATGYHRKHAIRVLKNKVQVQNRLKGKTKTYQHLYCGEVVQALEQSWEIYGHICSKRLQPFLPEAIRILERCQEIELSKDTKELLLKISSASIDRCLRSIRIQTPHGLRTTKPGGLLKSLIPVRTFTEWDEQRPGFLEIDLVAHCRNTTEGQFLCTLTCPDLCTGWTEVTGLLHRSQEAVSEAIHLARQRLPFSLLGIDSDNGGEFINDLLYRYCLAEKITFTRSRPYQKNDQAHVEQKNWSVVRHTVGYDRWETEQELALLESIYDDLRLYINSFQPSLKLMAKERIDKKTRKRYDPAKTPYQRVLERKDISLEAKAQLAHLYVQLNPAELAHSPIAQVLFPSALVCFGPLSLLALQNWLAGAHRTLLPVDRTSAALPPSNPLDGRRGTVVGSFPLLLLPHFISVCSSSPTLLHYTLMYRSRCTMPCNTFRILRRDAKIQKRIKMINPSIRKKEKMIGEPLLVMLIEDNIDHAELVIRTLKDHLISNKVRHFQDGQSALDYLFRQGEFSGTTETQRPHVILLDLRLPRVDGIDVLKTIKEDAELKSIPVVVLTTSETEKDVARAYHNHANSYLVKPVGFDDFKKLMNDLGFYWLGWNVSPDARK